MTKLKLYLISAFFLVATVPWFFTELRTNHILGFPPWAFYSFCATILYAIVIAFLLQRYWSVLAGDDKDLE